MFSKNILRLFLLLPFCLPAISTDGKIIKQAPPEIKIANFFVTMENYNTKQGLALSSISCGFKDKAGNLWFGTFGGGLSRYDGKSVVNFTMAQGLANNNVRCMTEDKMGNFWFGTFGGGVSVYNGKYFKTFTVAQGLANNNVRCVTQDKMGNLWFGTSGGGVSKYSPSTGFKQANDKPGTGAISINITNLNGLINNDVWSIAEDNNGYLWFGTNGGGISKYDPSSPLQKGLNPLNYTTSQGLASNNIRNIILDKSGNIWIATEGGGVSKYSQCLDIGEQKCFTNYTTAQGLASNNVKCITEDKRGNLWFGTYDGGLSNYDPLIGFTNYTTSQGLVNNAIFSITEDKTGNLWLGTDGSGISKFDGKSLISFTRSQGPLVNFVYSIAEDKTGSLWFGTEGGGVYKYSQSKDKDGKIFFTRFTTNQGLANNYVTGIIRDREDNIWFSTNGGGISKYIGDANNDGKQCFINLSTAQGLASNNVRSLYEDKEGNLWFGTEDSGISKYTLHPNIGEKSFTNFTTKQGLANNSVYCITQDKSGNLWFGTKGGGLSKYSNRIDGEGEKGTTCFTNFSMAQGLSNNDIMCITEDKSGNLWFGTAGGGVNILRAETISLLSIQKRKDLNKTIFQTLSTKNGLAENNVYDIIEDKNRNIIIGTNLGFTILKGGLKEGMALQAKNGIEYFNENTGYPIKDLNTNGMYIDSKGIVWAGTADKLVRFDYSLVNRNTDPLTLVIQNIKINNENICWNVLSPALSKEVRGPSMILEEVANFGRQLTEEERDTMHNKFNSIQFDSISSDYPLPQGLILPFENNQITFEFVAIEPARPSLVHYQYILEGYDKQWSSLTNKTNANFGNIQEGTYTFKLKAQSPDGVYAEPIIYTFRVLPPFYRTWWAYGIYILLFSSFIYLFYRRRTALFRKQIKALSLEHKLLRSQMNPHFIYNSLNSIQSFILKNDIKESANYISNFARLMRLILENSRMEYVSIEKELETLKLYLKLQQLRFKKAFDYTIDIAPQIDIENVLIPPMFAQPFIENAIEHGLLNKEAPGNLKIRFKLENNFIIFEVEDNGIGRKQALEQNTKKESSHKSLATKITQERIEILNKQNSKKITFDIIDLKDHTGAPSGTITTFKIPYLTS